MGIKRVLVQHHHLAAHGPQILEHVAIDFADDEYIALANFEIDAATDRHRKLRQAVIVREVECARVEALPRQFRDVVTGNEISRR